MLRIAWEKWLGNVAKHFNFTDRAYHEFVIQSLPFSLSPFPKKYLNGVFGDVMLDFVAEAFGLFVLQARQHHVAAARAGGMHNQFTQPIVALQHILRHVQVLNAPQRYDGPHPVPDAAFEVEFFLAQVEAPEAIAQTGQR